MDTLPQPPSQPVISTPQTTQPPQTTWKSVLSTIGVLLIAPVVALFLTAFVFQSYQVDGPSMQSTLEDKDRLVVWKVPRTWARVTHHPYIPKRGDVVIFVEKTGYTNSSNNKDKQLIKRVIGLPGDRVVIKDSTVTVYNTEHPDGFQPDRTLPYGTAITETSGEVDVKLQAGEIYALGDNRSNSYDSRMFGPVDANDIVGKLAIRVMPLDSIKRF